MNFRKKNFGMKAQFTRNQRKAGQGSRFRLQDFVTNTKRIAAETAP